MRNLFLFHVLSVCVLWNACSTSDKRNPDRKSFRYAKSLQDLREKFSDSLMEVSGRELTELDSVNHAGLYHGNMQSLSHHSTPEWYSDAKLGIFFDWGLYSVAGYGTKGWNRARYPDWYLDHMYSSSKEYHQSTWGKDFHRDDFIPLFTAENFDAEAIMELVKTSGARYFVPFNKHHDGYCLWDSRYTQRDVKDMFPGRDITAGLVNGCRKRGIYHGFYFSVEDYEYPLIDANGGLVVRYWSKSGVPNNSVVEEVKGEILGPFIDSLHNRMLSGKIPVRNFVNEYILPQAKEFIDTYDPDILWFDGEWNRPASYYRTPELVAYFYNRAEGRKEVASNDRMGMGTREHCGDFYTSETDEVVGKLDHPWEENRSMSESYGYNRNDSLTNYLTSDELIGMLVRIVAKGGNLNLIVNPDGTGRIPEMQQDLLIQLGEWLQINGEAIYGTRPYEKICDNTQLGQPVWYTMSKDSLFGYAIVLDWPMSETFICAGANIVWDTEVHLLGYDKPLEWVDTGSDNWGMSARVPEEMLHDPAKRPCKHAWVLKFRFDKDNLFGH
ncbi:MAG: alpha-L-fucosidase [Bacteroidales bacterium]